MDKDKLFISCFERASKQNPKINRGERGMELGKTVMLKDENDALHDFWNVDTKPMERKSTTY